MEAYYSEITKGSFYIYIVLLLTAGITDVWKFLIPNLISALLIVLFIALAFAQPFPVDWWSHLGAMLAFFIVGLLLYRFSVLGAGDVKLITALCLWAGFSGLPNLLLGVALSGGVLALALIAVRQLLFSMTLLKSDPGAIQLPKVLVKGSPVPYGVGIAAGGIWLGINNPIFGYF